MKKINWAQLVKKARDLAKEGKTNDAVMYYKAAIFMMMADGEDVKVIEEYITLLEPLLKAVKEHETIDFIKHEFKSYKNLNKF